MQQKNRAENFLSDMQSALKDMFGTFPTATPVAMKTILEMQRKNFQAVSEANQRVLQGWQNLAQRQTEMVSQFVQDNSGLARDTLGETSAQEKLSRQTDMIKSYYQKSLINSQELGEIMRRCTIETADVLNRRIVASMAEIKSTADQD